RAAGQHRPRVAARGRQPGRAPEAGGYRPAAPRRGRGRAPGREADRRPGRRRGAGAGRRSAGPAGGGRLMSADVADLAMLLFLPWFLLLGASYWWMPRDMPVAPARRRFDELAPLQASGLALVAGRWRAPLAAAKPV